MKINEMQCKNFREIADSYLSDELLVETNHGVFQHLENCENCRRELGGRREVRSKLRVAVMSAPESNIDAVFAANLQQSLEKEAFRTNGFSDFFRMFNAPKAFALTAAALIIAVLIGFSFWKKPSNQNEIAATNQTNQNEIAATNIYKTAWTNLSDEAISDHTHCGLDKYDYWIKNDVNETAEEKAFKEKVLNQIQSETAEPVKLVSIHDCDIEGENFHHAILNVGNHVVSITQPAMETALEANTGISDIFELRREDFELAGFTDGGKAYYVVSDLAKDENKRIAEIFSGSLQVRNLRMFRFATANYALYTASANF